MKNFWVRTASATVYALLFLGSIYSGKLLGNYDVGLLILMAFLLFVTCGCTFEFFRIVGMQKATPCRWLGYIYAVCGFIVVAMMSWSRSSLGFTLLNLGLALLPLLFALSVIIQLWNHSDQPFREAAYTMVPLLYVALPLGLMPTLHTEWNVLVMLLIMVWVNDSAAYMGGSWWGKKKMWPRHSPGKTWTGTIIGVVVTIILALTVGPLFNHDIAWYHWLVLGLICSVVDTLGDLAESQLKRSVGLKDSGNIMPGHGGFLDRFDSLLVITPFAAAFLFLFAS